MGMGRTVASSSVGEVDGHHRVELPGTEVEMGNLEERDLTGMKTLDCTPVHERGTNMRGELDGWHSEERNGHDRFSRESLPLGVCSQGLGELHREGTPASLTTNPTFPFGSLASVTSCHCCPRIFASAPG